MGCPRCVCVYRSRGCEPEALATVYSYEPEALAASLQYLRSQRRLNLPWRKTPLLHADASGRPLAWPR
jgi:hypothetical protein